MKNKRFFAGILVLVLVFGIIFVGCPTPTGDSDEKNPLKGTIWSVEGTDNEGTFTMTYTFSANSYTLSYISNDVETTNESGTYSVVKNTVNFIDQYEDTFTGTISNDTLIIGKYTLHKQ
jgi:hypothetical protein